MHVGKIGHASIVVEEGDVSCFMDPVLVDPFESECNRFDPPIRVDRIEAVRACNAIVLSHGHMDHFCVRSLAAFDRDIPVIFPRGEAVVTHALERLGFTQMRGVTAGERVSLDALSLFPTASRVPFPEMGVVFATKDATFWNMVDSVVDDRIIASVRERFGTVDLLFAKYQPLVETDLIVNALGSGFPMEKYGALLGRVWDIGARCVAPASCGYRYARAEWLNDRGFPITEAQFEADLRAGDPSVRVKHVPHGGRIEVGNDFHVEERGLPFVERLGKSTFSSFDWRPDRGVAPLAGDNPRGHSPETLKARTSEYLRGPFLAELRRSPKPWLERMRRQEVQWRLELVMPDAAPQVWGLDFARAEPDWTDARAFAKLHTSVNAAAIVDLLDGARNAYSLTFNDIRVIERLYAATREGLTRFGSVDDEPLMRILGGAADRRYIDRQIDEILSA